MTRRVEIELESCLSLDGRSEEIRQRTEGLLTRTEEGYILTYREGEDTGLGGTRTTLRLLEGRAELSRTGEVSSVMVFCPGETHRTTYKTPYGLIPMAVTARKVRSRFEEEQGTVELEYDLAMGDGPAAQTLLRLMIKEKERLS